MKCGTILALSLVLLISNNAASFEPEHIIGGHYAGKMQFKYQISLQIGKFHKCGGALVAADVVLTAAHCFSSNSMTGLENWPWMAVAGGLRVNDVTYRIAATTLYFHKKFVKKEASIPFYDIALLRLEKGFDVSSGSPIGLASLPKKGQDFTGQHATVSGFGYGQMDVKKNVETGIEEKVGSLSGILKYESVYILKPHECAVTDPRILCGRVQNSQYTHGGVCGGDSGGPLMIEKGEEAMVIGIVSSGPGDCDESKVVTGYTKLSEYETFIKNAIANKPDPSDTLVKNIPSMIFDIPSLSKPKLITLSPEAQAILGYLQIYKPKYDDEVKRLDPLLKEAEKILRRITLLKSVACHNREQYGAEVADLRIEYTAKQNQYKNALAANPLVVKVSKGLARLKQLETELYNL